MACWLRETRLIVIAIARVREYKSGPYWCRHGAFRASHGAPANLIEQAIVGGLLAGEVQLQVASPSGPLVHFVEVHIGGQGLERGGICLGLKCVKHGPGSGIEL